jgi:hypothetical protein
MSGFSPLFAKYNTPYYRSGLSPLFDGQPAQIINLHHDKSDFLNYQYYEGQSGSHLLCFCPKIQILLLVFFFFQ